MENLRRHKVPYAGSVPTSVGTDMEQRFNYEAKGKPTAEKLLRLLKAAKEE